MRICMLIVLQKKNAHDSSWKKYDSLEDPYDPPFISY